MERTLAEDLVITSVPNGILVAGLQDFCLAHIFECGQCFRWDREADGSYTGVALNRVVNLKETEAGLRLIGTTHEEFMNLWVPYFDLNTDYGAIKGFLTKEDPVMAQAVAFGSGIRILRQEFWETLASFIISANNNIPRIKGIIGQLSRKYGQPLGSFQGKTYYSFPEPEVLAELSKEELLACNTGYRANYLIKAARQILDGTVSLEDLGEASFDAVHQRLMEFSGVGPKVANCVAFFALGKLEAFPVDVWIKRLMEHFYFGENRSEKEIEAYARSKYGKYAGYAQQYLFFYGREQGIGKGAS